MAYLMTVTGKVEAGQLGMILPHEHIVTDLRPHDAPGFGLVEEREVMAVMAPQILAALNAGITAIIECTPAGVGRHVLALRAVSVATGFPIVAAAGTYREAFMPDWLHNQSDGQLYDWLRREVTEGMDGTEIVGGFIKMAVSDSGITPLEERVLRAMGRVGGEFGVTVASHTVSGRLAMREAEILAEEGLPAERFVWVHTQNELDAGYHRAIAERGCYLEYDGIRDVADFDAYAGWIRNAFDWGLQDRVLLSQDAGWYRPGEPLGGEQRPYTFLPLRFLPYLLENGFSEADVKLLAETNPKRAFARE